jgi:hypothetical protein
MESNNKKLFRGLLILSLCIGIGWIAFHENSRAAMHQLIRNILHAF